MFLLSLTATCQVWTVSLKAGLYTYNGLHFGLRHPQTNYWIHRLLPVLRRALVALDMAPERDASRVATSPLMLEGAPG